MMIVIEYDHADHKPLRNIPATIPQDQAAVLDLISGDNLPMLIVDTEQQFQDAFAESFVESAFAYFRVGSNEIHLHPQMKVLAKKKVHAKAFGCFLAVVILHGLSHWKVCLQTFNGVIHPNGSAISRKKILASQSQEMMGWRSC
mgnify:CR=1 FL=1